MELDDVMMPHPLTAVHWLWFSWLQETSAVKVNEEVDITFDPIVKDNSCPPQPKHKLFKEQRNLSRKQDSETEKWTERTKKHLVDRHGEEEKSQHVVEVDVEINIAGVSDDEETPPPPVKTCSKRKSTTPQRERRKPRAHTAAADVPSPSPAAANTAPSSPSQASIMSESAAEELCHLRNYYSKQLRRINYISHEYLGQPAQAGVLACIREPLRSLRLPSRGSISQTARSLWTRVSGRRKTVHRWHHSPCVHMYCEEISHLLLSCHHYCIICHLKRPCARFKNTSLKKIRCH